MHLTDTPAALEQGIRASRVVNIRLVITSINRPRKPAVVSPCGSADTILWRLNIETVATLDAGPGARAAIAHAVCEIQLSALGMILDKRNVQIQSPSCHIDKVEVAAVICRLGIDPHGYVGRILGECLCSPGHNEREQKGHRE